MIQNLELHVKELEDMKRYPKELFYIGNSDLLQKQKVSIVGSRKPNQYARQLTYEITSKLSARDVCVVSGGAIGIDAIAHKAAKAENTIMVAGTGLDKRYPTVNKNLIEDIEKSGLVLSQFQAGTPSQKYNFPLRNEVVVALGEVLIVMYADKNSGTMRSVEYALKMGKKVYVLPHRIGESEGTNELLAKGLAEAIYDVEAFVAQFGSSTCSEETDAFSAFCKTSPSYEEALKRYPTRVFEAELLGEISIVNGKVLQN